MYKLLSIQYTMMDITIVSVDYCVEYDSYSPVSIESINKWLKKSATRFISSDPHHIITRDLSTFHEIIDEFDHYKDIELIDEFVVKVDKVKYRIEDTEYSIKVGRSLSPQQIIKYIENHIKMQIDVQRSKISI